MSRDLTAVSALLAAMPDPAAVDEHWRRTCREMYDRGHDDGFNAGYAQACADVKAAQQGLYQLLAGYAEIAERRWRIYCDRCRRSQPRHNCPGCQYRTRETFSQPASGDYPGRGSAAA